MDNSEQVWHATDNSDVFFDTGQRCAKRCGKERGKTEGRGQRLQVKYDPSNELLLRRLRPWVWRLMDGHAIQIARVRRLMDDSAIQIAKPAALTQLADLIIVDLPRSIPC